MAFDRLEQGYKAQRDFASNVAHEIRTPIAVLKSSIDRIDDAKLKQTLSQDAMQLDRIFGQLIDLSRADAALQSGFEAVNLRNVAVEVATDLVPVALGSGRRLSVIGDEAVLVHGNAGLLGIALANVVRNALQYTTENSEVEIELHSNPAGWRVLDRGPGVPRRSRWHCSSGSIAAIKQTQAARDRASVWLSQSRWHIRTTRLSQSKTAMGVAAFSRLRLAKNLNEF